ncbi:hypothetical protein ACNKHV_27055 [Shigella flexneri]
MPCILSPEASLSLGVWFARITGLSMFLAYTGAFFALLFTVESHHQGTPKALWPEPMTRLNADGDAVYRHVDAVRVGSIFILLSFVWWRYHIGII